MARGPKTKGTGGAGEFPLSDDYLESVKTLARKEMELDWRKLGKKEPPMWPGMLWMYPAQEAVRETARLTESLELPEARELYFFGHSTAGIMYAFDRKGRVLIFDELEIWGVDDGIRIAKSFAALMDSRLDSK